MSYRKFTDENIPCEAIDWAYSNEIFYDGLLFRIVCFDTAKDNARNYCPFYCDCGVNYNPFVQNPIDPRDFAMSVQDSLDSCKNICAHSKRLRNNCLGFACGKFNSNRGILSLDASQASKHHFDYFLFDYKTNSPASDFEICLMGNES